jgi:MATE family multidrug resistance protein
MPVMMFNLMVLLLKLPLSAIFMYGRFGMPALGAPGCAIASAVDATLLAILAWGWCLNHPDYAQFRIRARFAAPDRNAIVTFLRWAFPSA